MIYFDHNATTPLDAEVLDAMMPFLKSFYGNPSSLYRHGRVARSAIDDAREKLATLVDADAAQIIFTSGGTEANNLALASLEPLSRIAVSAIEHPSIIEYALYLKTQGHGLAMIDVDANGMISEDALDKAIRFAPHLLSIMLANNETGAVLDIAGYARQCRQNGIIIHTDAVQALGKIPVSFRQSGVHLMTLSSHKIYGPKGCGALVIEKGIAISPLLRGGGQEQGLRAGTENVAAIVGFGKAAELAKANLNERTEHLLLLKKRLEQGLDCIPGLTIFAQQADRLPNTVQFGINEVDGEMLLMKLDKKAIAVSSGSACASGGREPSPVLTAMGIKADQAKTAIRVSFGKSNTEAEIGEFIEILKSFVCQI